MAPLALLLPRSAWALRCGTYIVQQGETRAQVRGDCGAPFFMDRYVGHPGVGVTSPAEPGAAVVSEVWYYNFGPQCLMVRLDFSGGVLARERMLGHGFTGQGGSCDFNDITTGLSVAGLIGRCGFPASRGRNPLATAVALGAQAPAWGEAWTYPAEGSVAAFRAQLQDGWVTDVQFVR
ncbi:MAG TPA: DUF2845 domain-containing protein [Rhodanobacteraceae bacterium]|nr:DUF2845 domain-containing protein [Rhodanobacteraceae bacterium]